MNRDHFLTLATYDEYANKLVFDGAAQLNENDFKRVVGYLSVHATLVHILAAQALWLSRLQGNAMKTVLTPHDFPMLDDIRLYADDLSGAWRELIANASEDDLQREIHYLSTRGEPFHYPLWQALSHLFNHSTNHRGELSIMLTQLGYPLPDLDLIFYLRKQSGQ